MPGERVGRWRGEGGGGGEKEENEERRGKVENCAELIMLKGADLVLKYYSRNVYEALTDLFPEIKLDPTEFEMMPCMYSVGEGIEWKRERRG